VLLDVRTATESSNSLQAFIHELAGDAQHTVTDAWLSEPTPLPASDQPIQGYYTPPNSDIVTRARQAIARGIGREPELISYQFATDGRHFVAYGIPVIGFAPGEEGQAHTAGESIAISQMGEALRGYVQLLREF
jgi:acetylornithine deacetylase/succinyl-diaminopimelate desuccinylase-like protein